MYLKCSYKPSTPISVLGPYYLLSILLTTLIVMKERPQSRSYTNQTKRLEIAIKFDTQAFHILLIIILLLVIHIHNPYRKQVINNVVKTKQSLQLEKSLHRSATCKTCKQSHITLYADIRVVKNFIINGSIFLLGTISSSIVCYHFLLLLLYTTLIVMN